MTRFRSGKTLIILLLGCSLLSVGLGVGAAMFLGKKASASSEKSKKHKAEHVEPKMVHPLGEMVVNLADHETMRYAKISVAVGFEEKVGEEEIKELEPVLRDALIGVITGKTFKELHKPGGLKHLKEELTETMGEQVEKHPIVAVYLEGFAMQ